MKKSLITDLDKSVEEKNKIEKDQSEVLAPFLETIIEELSPALDKENIAGVEEEEFVEIDLAPNLESEILEKLESESHYTMGDISVSDQDSEDPDEELLRVGIASIQGPNDDEDDATWITEVGGVDDVDDPAIENGNQSDDDEYDLDANTGFSDDDDY